MAHLLVIDDSKMTRRLLTAILERAGHEVEAWEPPPANELLHRLHHVQVQLAITDYSFPNCEYDGLQILKKIRILKPRLPVVLLTSTQDPEILADFWMENITAILFKPEGFKMIPDVLANMGVN